MEAEVLQNPGKNESQSVLLRNKKRELGLNVWALRLSFFKTLWYCRYSCDNSTYHVTIYFNFFTCSVCLVYLVGQCLLMDKVAIAS